MTTFDFMVTDHGTIQILQPRTEEAEVWIEQHISEDAQRWGRNGVVIEPRYLPPIIDGIQDDGLTVAYTH